MNGVSDSEPQPAAVSGRRAVATAVSVSTVGVLPAFLTGALGVELRADLHFSVLALGLAISGFFGSSALGSAWLGRVTERLGAPQSMRIAATFNAVALMAMALLARSFASLLLLLVLAGLANSLIQPAANLFLAERTGLGRRGLAFGIKQSAIPAAVMVSGAAVPVLALTVGWRATYAAAALLALAVVPIIPAGRLRAGASRADSTDRRPRRVRPLVYLAAVGVLGAFGANALGAFLVSSAVDTGISQAAAGWLLAAASALCLTARVGAGWLADRTGSDGLRLLIFMLAVGSLGYLLLANPSPALFVVGAALAFGAGWGWPGLFNLSVVARNPEAPAAATGITQTGIYIGAGAGPLAYGALASASSFETAWTVMGVLALAAAALALLVHRSLDPPPPPPARHTAGHGQARTTASAGSRRPRVNPAPPADRAPRADRRPGAHRRPGADPAPPER